MTDGQKSIAPKALLALLAKRGFLPDEKRSAAEKALRGESERVPVVLQVFSGLGAFLSAIPFVIFLGVSNLVNFSSEWNLFGWGIVFVAAAFPVGRATSRATNLKTAYFHQLALILMGTGKILAIAGGTGLLPFHEVWNVVIMLVVLAGVTYHVFASSVDRFLSPLFALAFVPIAISQDFERVPEIQGLLMNGYFVLQVGILALLSRGPFRRSLYSPLYFAVLFSIANVVLSLSATSSLDEFFGLTLAYNTYLISGLLAAGFAFLIYRASGNFAKIGLVKAGLILAALAVLAILPAPGVLFGLILLFLGYRDYNKYVTLIGLGFLAYFIFRFYYDLDMTLLTKSMILMGSGILLMTGYLVMRMRRWHEHG